VAIEGGGVEGEGPGGVDPEEGGEVGVAAARVRESDGDVSSAKGSRSSSSRNCSE
jgi:hypothetical protein